MEMMVDLHEVEMKADLVDLHDMEMNVNLVDFEMEDLPTWMKSHPHLPSFPVFSPRQVRPPELTLRPLV